MSENKPEASFDHTQGDKDDAQIIREGKNAMEFVTKNKNEHLLSQYIDKNHVFDQSKNQDSLEEHNSGKGTFESKDEEQKTPTNLDLHENDSTPEAKEDATAVIYKDSKETKNINSIQVVEKVNNRQGIYNTNEAENKIPENYQNDKDDQNKNTEDPNINEQTELRTEGHLSEKLFVVDEKSIIKENEHYKDYYNFDKKLNNNESIINDSQDEEAIRMNFEASKDLCQRVGGTQDKNKPAEISNFNESNKIIQDDENDATHKNDSETGSTQDSRDEGSTIQNKQTVIINKKSQFISNVYNAHDSVISGNDSTNKPKSEESEKVKNIQKSNKKCKKSGIDSGKTVIDSKSQKEESRKLAFATLHNMMAQQYAELIQDPFLRDFPKID